MPHGTFNETRIQSLGAVGAAFWLGVFWLAGQVVIAQPNNALQAISGQAFDKLGLVDGQIVDVSPAATATGGLQLLVPVNGVSETLELYPLSVRSPNYTVLVQQGDGTYAQAEPTPEHSYRGSIVGKPNSIVAVTYDETGVRGSIHVPDGRRLWVEPLANQIAAASPKQHIVYRDEDTITSQDSCAEPVHSHDRSDNLEPVEGAVAGSPGFYIAEIAIDADHEYFLDYGNISAVQDQINTVINAMNVEYERDVLIRHVITTIIVRSAASDPYTSSSSGVLLGEFKNHWNNYQVDVHRDVAQLFTGRDLDSNYIGVAYLGEICTSWAYGVVQSNFSGSALAYQTDLSAHELGHNWAADHCSCSNPPYTMNPTIIGSNRFHPTLSVPDMIAYRDTRGCLDVGDDLLRITISAPSTTFEIGQAVQLSATADFRYGADQIVTSEVIWTVDRSEFADVSSTGLLTVLGADGESCVTVNASYTSEGITRTAQRQITVKDPAKALTLVSSYPPDHAIDAGRPTYPNGGNLAGWRTFELSFNSEPCLMKPSRFTVTQLGGTQTAPVVSSVESLSGNVVRVTLNQAIDAGAWTTIDDTLSEVSVRVGFLPGDVNGNGVVTPSDILALIDSLNGLSSLPLWSTDLDRSGSPAPADILTIIDLLNGASGNAAWNGASLPEG
jgi:hypothetical protein